MLDPDQKVERKERTRNIKTFLPEEGENYVFISYKSDDWKNVLIDIVEAMQERYGLRVYYDANFDKDNDLWIDNMKSAIKSSRCKAILAFISKGYMESYACLMELLYSKTFEVKMIHDDQEVPIIPILINGLNGIDYALSNKSEELKVKEWDVYAKLLEQAIDSDLDKKITRAIKGLRDSAHKASIEQMSRVMRYLLDGNHERTWTEKSKDVFMENLYDTLSHIAPSRDDKVFDSTLIRNAASQEEQKNRQTAETDTTSSRKLPAKSAEPSEAEPVKRRPGRPKAEKPNANGKSEKAGQPQKSKPASGTLKELLEKNKISVGTEIYIEGYPNSEAVITEEDKVLFKGNQRTIKEYIDFASGMRLTKQEPLSVIFEKNPGRSLRGLLNEEEAGEKQEQA